jgi:hypothetical protein
LVAAYVGYGLERSEQWMPGPAKKARNWAADPAGLAGDRGAEIYDRHAAAVYGQALLMLDDAGLAGEIARDVIVAECALPAASPRVAARVSARLAVSTLQRCQERMAAEARKGGAPPGRHARGQSASPATGGPASDGKERALLGLVLFGGMGYREAARELAISPARAAVLLRAELVTRGGSSPDTRLRPAPLAER